jgi:hypothetical protein
MTSATASTISAFTGEVERACIDRAQPFGLRELLFCIRDIPYGRPALPRDPASVVADWKGTCSGKHLLTRAIFDTLGLRSRLFCLPYRLDDALDALPREVVQRYVGQGLWDVHNYLELDTPAGPVKVDVTWSRELVGFGFHTTLDWDGAHDFRIAAPPGEPVPVMHDSDLTALKDELLQRLNPPAARALRERYIEDLSVFASGHSTSGGRADGIAATLDDLRRREAHYGG